MRKDIVIRFVGGFLIGVTIGQIVQLCISLGLGQESYLAVVPNFRALFASETIAVCTQIFLTGMIGVTFAMAALVFEIARWGMLKQYIVHFCVTASVWIPIVMFLWMPKTVANIFSLLASFIGTYIVTWLMQYQLSKRDIEKINAILERGEFHDH
ncbi:DUF3021 domain-containing protein [Lysinibacillus sphaericus]|uniref:DUF3021 domain-containing protein n=1 Tax=Lysinibacillus sphaericus TaxID=1421 RepID=UPI003F798764